MSQSRKNKLDTFIKEKGLEIDLSKKENSNIIPLKILKSLLSKENINFLNPFIAEHKCPGI